MTTLGPFPAGDPAAMRRDAALLHADATNLRTYAGGLTTTTEGMPFKAPVAERVRSHMQAELTKLKHAAQLLDDLGTYLSKAAGTLEGAQSRWRADLMAIEAKRDAATASRAGKL